MRIWSAARRAARTAALFAALLTAAVITSPEAAEARWGVPDPDDLAALGLYEGRLTHGGMERAFLFREPRDTGRAVPVLLALHGGGQSMRRMFSERSGGSRGWAELAEREDLLLLAPNGMTRADRRLDPLGDRQHWNDLRDDVRGSMADDSGFLLALLDWAEKRFHVDKSRIYVVGASNGGMMAMRMLIEAPGRFAAGAAFIAAMPLSAADAPMPLGPTPLLMVNGISDPLVRWEGGPVANNRGETLSVEASVEWWVRANGAEPTGVARLLPDLDPDDGCRLLRRDHAAGPGGAPVVLVTMQGGGHAMPSRAHPLPDSMLVRRLIGRQCRDAEGAEMAWRFLSGFRRSEFVAP